MRIVWDMLQLVQASEARPSSLATCANSPLLGMWRGHSRLQRRHSCRRRCVGDASACPGERGSTCGKLFPTLHLGDTSRSETRGIRQISDPPTCGCRVNSCATKRPPFRAGLRPACLPGQAKACPTKTAQERPTFRGELSSPVQTRVSAPAGKSACATSARKLHTSLDGIDGAIVEASDPRPRRQGGQTQ